jgi:hemolysin activation/secretion protein
LLPGAGVKGLARPFAGGLLLVVPVSSVMGEQPTPSGLGLIAQASRQDDILPRRRGSGAPALPPVELAPPAPPKVAAPPPTPNGERRQSDEPGFVLKGVRVDGNTALDRPAIEGVVAPFLNHPAGLRELEAIRRGITLLYVDRGYINSGAVIPDQTVRDGILAVQVVEGRLTEIDLSGNRHYRTSYLIDRLQRGAGMPFNVNDLARAQQILLDDPFLTRLNLNVVPGLLPGEARLMGEVTEAAPYSLAVQIANDQSPTVGEVRGQLQGVVGNLFGVGDVLAMQYGRSQGLNDGAVSYSIPISSDDTRVSLRYDINSNQVVTEKLSPLNIASRYQSFSVGLSRPFYRTPEQNLTLGASLEWRQSQTFLLNEPFSFVAGADNGRTNVTALRFYQSWLDQNANRVLALRSTFSLGLHMLGATVTGTKPSGQFIVWLGQAQFVRRIFGDWEALARGSLQLSNSPLFPIEQFVIGGMSTVRGYREYLTAADNAFAGTLELRVPVGRVTLPGLSTSDTAGTVQLVPFFDHGVGWNTSRDAPPDATLSSVGVGLRWFVGSGVLAEIYYGYGLRKVHVGSTLQDRGVHFRVTASVF